MELLYLLLLPLLRCHLQNLFQAKVVQEQEIDNGLVRKKSMGVMLLVVPIWATTIIMRGETTRNAMEFFLYRRRQLLHLVVVVGFLPVGVRDNANGGESGVRSYKVGRKGSQDQDQDHRAARLHLRLSLQMYPQHQLPRRQTGRSQGKGVLLLRQRLLLRPAQ